MTKKLDLTERVTPSSVADALLEACLPVASNHRQGGLEQARKILAEHPEAATENIWVAAACGEVAAVRLALEDEPELANTCGGTRGWEPLLYLCFSRFLRWDQDRATRMHDAARLLLEAGADPNCFWTDPAEAEGNRETPLYGAVGIANDIKLARLLLDKGADPNDGETPYHMVEHQGVPAAELIVPLLNELGRGTALGHMLDYDDLEGLRKLLELGCDPNGPTPFKNMPLHQAVWRGREKPFFDVLLEHGAEIDRENGDGRSAYVLAARSGRKQQMSWLFDAGADTTLSKIDEFLAACTVGDAVRANNVLKEHPEVVGELTTEDRAVICDAAGAGNTAGVALMLDCGWNIDTRGLVWGETPLHRAALEGRAETAALLIANGADLTVRDRVYGSSPLGWARQAEEDEVIGLLCADADQLDLRDAAEVGATRRTLDLLDDRDPNEAFDGGDPGVLLRAAVVSGSRALVESLLARGADPTLRNREGVSARDIAHDLGMDGIQELLDKAVD